MTSSHSTPVRSVRALSDLLQRMTRLADWLAENKTACQVMTLTHKDFDLLRKYPTASGITENNGTVYWRGFELRAQAAPINQGRK
jgi:hypothetical protein